jgi:beta propeller repeat protein
MLSLSGGNVMRKHAPAAVLLALLLLLALIAPAAASPPYAPEELLWTGAGVSGMPDVWGSQAARVTAWECDNGGDWDVVVRGLDGSITVVPLGATDQRHPALMGSFDPPSVFYEHDPSGTGDWDIYASDLDLLMGLPGAAIGSESPIATGPGRQLDPDASGGWVVYEDDSRGNWDICAYNVTTGVRRRIVSNTAAQLDPSVSGAHVVFADRRNGNWDIYDYNLTTSKLRRLTANRSHQTKPHISQGMVVYQDNRNGNWDVYAYTLSSGKERRLTTSPHHQTAPRLDDKQVSGLHRVVYTDARNGDTNIYVFDLKTGVGKRVTDDTGPQSGPVISGSHVAWTDGRAAAPGIYGCRLSFPRVSLDVFDGTPPYNATVEVTGSLQLSDDAWAGQRVYVKDRGAKRWTTVGGAGPDFSVLIPNIVRKVTLSAVYPGDAAHLPAITSSTIAIRPRARLTTPVLKVKPGRNVDGRYVTTDDCTVTGYLRPRHAAGTRAVQIRCYRWRPGTFWEYVKTVKVKVTNYSTYSKYRGTVTLKDGMWKVMAVHADADHAVTETGFSRTITTYL